MPDEILAGLREISRANDTPLHDAIDKLGTGGEGFELDAARTESGAVSVEAGGTKYLGKGWSISGGVAYAQQAWSAVGKLIWKPKGGA